MRATGHPASCSALLSGSWSSTVSTLLVPIARRTALACRVDWLCQWRSMLGRGTSRSVWRLHLHAVSSPPTGPATAAARTAVCLTSGYTGNLDVAQLSIILTLGCANHPKQRRADTMVTAGHMVRRCEHQRRVGSERLPRRSGRRRGVGGGVLDRLRELGLPVAGLKGGTAPIDKERFVDKRAEWFWSPREAVRERRGRHRPRRRRPRRAALGDQVEVDVAGPDRDRVDGRDTQARSPLPRPRRRPGPTPSPSWTCLQSTSSRTRARHHRGSDVEGPVTPRRVEDRVISTVDPDAWHGHKTAAHRVRCYKGLTKRAQPRRIPPNTRRI